MSGQGDAVRCRRGRGVPAFAAWTLCCLCAASLPAQAQSVRDTPFAHDATPLRAPSFRLIPFDAAFAPVPLHLWLALPPAAASEPAHGSAAAAEPPADGAALGIRIRGSGDLAGAWTRHAPCEPGARLSCEPARFPQLRPDLQLAVQARGSLSERVHVDVDYEQAREFDAANRIRAWYRGGPNEVLQRLEFGDVSLKMPASRFLTRGVPAGNFGVLASAQLGAVELETLFAQQNGDVLTQEFRLAGGGRAGVEQAATLSLEDADYVRAQFFFVLEPSLLHGYPHVDVLRLQPADAPAVERPAAGRGLELYRDERLPGAAQAGAAGLFPAEAVAPGSAGERHAGMFRRLLPGQDYTVHASGLWIVLRAPLRPEEALAVAYRTQAGDTVGSLDAESAPAGTVPRLRLLRGPHALHRPGSGTWLLEMRQVYRVDGTAEVEPSSIEVSISLGGAEGGATFRDVHGRRLSLLQFFGLDEHPPSDALDESRVYRPARENLGSAAAGTFIIFPTLRPFAAPAALTGAGLSADELMAALGADANAAIYEASDPVVRAAAGRFRLQLGYRLGMTEAASSFSLGAFAIRESSERLYLGARRLERDIDYLIDYDLGLVTLTGARGALESPDAELRATWEQKPLFSVAPTNLFAGTARHVGGRTQLELVGLYQVERTLIMRPLLGAEAGSAFTGSASARVDLGGALLDRLVPGRSRGLSSARLSGELAFSAPVASRTGVAYLDDFEAGDEVRLSVRRQDWQLGSAPQTLTGDRATLPHVLDAASAAPLVWQHDIAQDGALHGALLPSRDIDATIHVSGAELPEPVMWLTFGRAPGDVSPLPAPVDPRRWRSLTTVFSTSGLDLSRAEHLELYVRADAARPIALIFDLGTVGEDAFFVDSLGRTGGVRADGRRWGLGVLDEEASVVDREVWGIDADRRGLWDQSCTGDPLLAFPLGDARANCTRGNGARDTEDLNGNGVLDVADGAHFRYVVELDRLSEYLVRDTAETRTGFRLYRIPLRSGTALNGADAETWRFIRHMRITLAGEAAGARTITVARMRLVGSRWLRRDDQGVHRGLFGVEAGSTTGTVTVGPVSRLTDGARYASPPGVADAVVERGEQYRGGSVEINEKSLRLRYDELQHNERAEVYFRYPQQARNLLAYRELRLWVLPVRGSWGEHGNERFTVRLGTDPNNFYYFQTRLRPVIGERATASADWMPELVIDFEPWMQLRAEAERRLLERGSARPDTVWSADSSYAVVLQDRARAPNLAAVREITFAVYNAGPLPVAGEVWIDELRTGRAEALAGAAGTVRLDLAAGDIANVSIALTQQGAPFRQLGDAPHNVGGSDLALAADLRLERVLPESWGVELPLSIAHATAAEAPRFLPHSDVEAARLDGLRSAGSGTTRISLGIRPRTKPSSPLLALLLDGAALRLGYARARSSTLMSRAETSSYNGELHYRRLPVRHDVAAVPAPLQAVLRAVTPAAVHESDAYQRLLSSRLRWTPASLSFGTALHRHSARVYRFDRIVASPTDDGVHATEAPRQALRSDVSIGLRPFEPLHASLSIATDRDLLATRRASASQAERSAIAASRGSIGGINTGWEAARLLGTSLSYRPELTRWLRVGYTFDNRHALGRSPSFLELDSVHGSARMQHRFESSRSTTRTFALRPDGMLRAAGLDSASALVRMMSRVENVELSRRDGLASQFERAVSPPDIGYQLGLGGYAAFTAAGRDTARRAQAREQLGVSAIVLVAPGTRLDVSYSEADTRSFDAYGGTRFTRETGWPRASLGWRPAALPAALERFVSSVSASAGVQRTERTQWLDDSRTAQPRSVSELSFPLSLALQLPHDVRVAWRASFASGSTFEPAGGIESSGHQQDLTLSARLQPPGSWRARMGGPLTVSLALAEQHQRQCRHAGFAALDGDCIAFLDIGSRSANLRMETKLSDVDVGLLVHWADRRSHAAARAGTSQLQLGLYGRFDVEAGRMPVGR
jgi:hypothetical protein